MYSVSTFRRRPPEPERGGRVAGVGQHPAGGGDSSRRQQLQLAGRAAAQLAGRVQQETSGRRQQHRHRRLAVRPSRRHRHCRDENGQSRYEKMVSRDTGGRSVTECG